MHQFIIGTIYMFVDCTVLYPYMYQSIVPRYQVYTVQYVLYPSAYQRPTRRYWYCTWMLVHVVDPLSRLHDEEDDLRIDYFDGDVVRALFIESMYEIVTNMHYYLLLQMYMSIDGTKVCCPGGII